MKGERTKRLGVTERLVWIGVGLGAVFWVLESAIHVYIFKKDNLFQEICRPEAHEIWMRLLVVVMFIAFAMYAQFIITQRRRAEVATKLAHAELNQIFQTAADGMRVIDKEFNVLRVNETFVTQSGVSRHEAIGKKCYEVFRGPLCHTPNCPLTKIMGGEERIEYDADKERNDGRKVPCIVTATAFRGPDGDLIGIVEDFKDITERKQAEEALEAERRRLFSLLDGLPAYVCLIAPDYSVRFANQFFREHFGDPYQRPCYEVLGGYEEPCKNCRPFDIFDTTSSVNWEWAAPHGLTYEIYDYPFHDVDGSPLVLELGIDITERKRAEQEKKRLEAQVRQAVKMEAIGTLAGGIAHDFNNLLMGIQGNISLIQENMRPGDPHCDRVQDIGKQVQSGARLTSRLLGYARKGKYEVKTISLNQLVAETSDTFGRTRKDIEVHLELEADLSAVEGDPGQIEQVLWNLYINAADAMPNGGDLILKTANVTHRDMKDKLYAPKPGDYVLLKVTDTGAGMDKSTMERVFDPFFTTKEMGRGTGLGLASTFGIIKGHGGYIDVDSEKGRGATFSLHLPSSEKRPSEATRPEEQVLQGRERVLLVDDEQSIRRVGKDLLEAMGYQVVLAKGGRDAIDVYRQNRDAIDIVLLDMVMPHLGGGKVYDRMKKINPDVKVLLSSGYSIDGEATEILERGCDGFIQKPFNMKQLSAKLREILDGH